ncbi:MAG: multiheme c-type cytochrome [Candidatus Rokuibacteriota bacterium]
MRFITLVGLMLAIGVAEAAPPPVQQCALCHRGIEDAHPKKTLTCTTCHRGDTAATTPDRAHAGMYANPGDLRVAEQTCGACHAAITKKVKSSIMAHRSGTQSGSLFPNGLQATREGVTFSMAPEPTTPGVTLPKGHPLPTGAVARLDPLPTFKESGNVFFDLLRKECTSCHLWTQAKSIKGNFRGTGCAACHMTYGEDGKSAGGDAAMPRHKSGRPLRHVLTKAVPVTQCATCHNGGSRAAMNFRGLMEAPAEGRQTFTYDQDLLHGHSYTQQTADVHFTRGMACIDCHTEREMHGDGQIYAKRHYEVEVRCESCHGTPDTLATGITAQGRKLRNVFVAAAPNLTGLVTLVGKLTGKTHVVPQLATLPVQPPGHEAAHLKKTECFTCHTAWAPTCYGCHIKMDYSAYTDPVNVSFDNLASEHSKQGWFRLTPGVRFADPEPVLGLNWRGKVVPFVSRAQPLFSYVNPAGVLEYDFKKLGFAHNPIVPHTVVRQARTCESCHASPRALGLGAFTSREHPKLEEFKQPADFRWDRIVDEGGRPVQAQTLDGTRPLNREEMDRLRAAPFKTPYAAPPEGTTR